MNCTDTMQRRRRRRITAWTNTRSRRKIVRLRFSSHLISRLLLPSGYKNLFLLPLFFLSSSSSSFFTAMRAELPADKPRGREQFLSRLIKTKPFSGQVQFHDILTHDCLPYRSCEQYRHSRPVDPPASSTCRTILLSRTPLQATVHETIFVGVDCCSRGHIFAAESSTRATEFFRLRSELVEIRHHWRVLRCHEQWFFEQHLDKPVNSIFTLARRRRRRDRFRVSLVNASWKILRNLYARLSQTTTKKKRTRSTDSSARLTSRRRSFFDLCPCCWPRRTTDLAWLCCFFVLSICQGNKSLFYLEHETPPSTTDVAKKNESTIQLQVYADASSRVNKHFTCRRSLSSFSFSFHFKRIFLEGNSTLLCTVLEIFIYHKDHSLVNCQSNMDEIHCRLFFRAERTA